MAIASDLSIRDDEFALFQVLLRREAGIALGPHKRSLLVFRLSPRLRALGLGTFAEYYRLVTSKDGGPELVQMIDRVCTNETHFFREPAQFALLEREIVPTWIRGGPRQIRVWSAGCSTGEEPYSAAMTLLHHLPRTGFRVDVLATDLSTRALQHAQRASFSIERASEIPAEYLCDYMRRGKGPQVGKMKAGPEIRGLVTFRRMNLTDEAGPSPGLFDLILCRNVIIYFDAATRARVMERLLECMRPEGYLFLGHAESMSGASDRLENVMPAVYRRRAPPGAPGWTSGGDGAAARWAPPQVTSTSQPRVSGVRPC